MQRLDRREESPPAADACRRAAGAVRDRQRQADPRPRPDAEASDKRIRARARAIPGQARTLTRHKRFAEHSLMLVFEGVDAAGKGGAIRRVTAALDARQYVTVPVAAPTDEERAQPYLWRFWRQIPPQGGITIFDRPGTAACWSSASRATAATADWMRAYDEINQFEEQLVDAGAIVVQVLAADQQGRAAAPLPGAREDAIQALQDHRRGLAQPQEMGRLRSGRLRHGRPHEHRDRAVDAGRGRRQELRARSRS